MLTHSLLQDTKAGRAASEEAEAGGPAELVQRSAFELKLSSSVERFRSLQERRRVDLVVIAARLDDGTLVRFDAGETPDCPVAKAVAASAAIPFVFRPVEIEGRLHCDGGIVSNLPAWTFDTRVVPDPYALVVTSEVEAEALTGPFPGGVLALLGRVARAGFFGARTLETRGLRNHLSLLLAPDAPVHSPASAVWWNFVPVFHLWKPFDVLREACRRSDLDPALVRRLNLWQGIYIAAIVAVLSTGLAASADPQLVSGAQSLSVLVGLLDVAQTVLLWLFISPAIRAQNARIAEVTGIHAARRGAAAQG